MRFLAGFVAVAAIVAVVLVAFLWEVVLPVIGLLWWFNLLR